ncbi:MAG TPA: S8 family serine peptidase [Planctomycetota bacterium]
MHHQATRAFALLLLLPLAAPLAVAQQDAPGGLFAEVPGEHEFTGSMIVRPLQLDALLERGHTLAEAEQLRLSAAAMLDGWRTRYYERVDEHVVSVPEGMDENSLSALLMATELYQYAEPNWMVYPLQIPNDPNYGSQWQHPVIHSPEGWDYNVGDQTRIAAWTDTGVDTDHPDLAASLIPGYNAVDRLTEAQGGDVEDIHGHGTFVSGCIGAIGNNGVGVAGVAWNISLMPVRVSNDPSGGAYLADLLDGARWAASNGARTISASYSGVDNAAVGTTGTDIKNLGGVYFYAAGNGGSDLGNFDYADTVVVGATDSSDNRASWSNYGTPIDVTGPGVSVYSTTLGGGYGSGSGTSFSTPIANGVTAVLWSANPFLTPDEAQQALYDGCDNIGAANFFGNGRVNVENSLLEALQGDMVLTVTNLNAGQTANFAVTGAAPGPRVYFTYSTTGVGTTVVNQLSISLGLASPVLLGSMQAGGGGTASINRNVPAGASGTQVWLQAAQSDDTSNIVALTVG